MCRQSKPPLFSCCTEASLQWCQWSEEFGSLRAWRHHAMQSPARLKHLLGGSLSSYGDDKPWRQQWLPPWGKDAFCLWLRGFGSKSAELLPSIGLTGNVLLGACASFQHLQTGLKLLLTGARAVVLDLWWQPSGSCDAGELLGGH